MIALTLVVSIANFVAGYALAVYLGWAEMPKLVAIRTKAVAANTGHDSHGGKHSGH